MNDVEKYVEDDDKDVGENDLQTYLIYFKSGHTLVINAVSFMWDSESGLIYFLNGFIPSGVEMEINSNDDIIGVFQASEVAGVTLAYRNKKEDDWK